MARKKKVAPVTLTIRITKTWLRPATLHRETKVAGKKRRELQPGDRLIWENPRDLDCKIRFRGWPFAKASGTRTIKVPARGKSAPLKVTKRREQPKLVHYQLLRFDPDTKKFKRVMPSDRPPGEPQVTVGG